MVGGWGGGHRQGAPVLICPVDRPTARSAMKESSVSPLRWLVMTPHPASLASFTACARRRATLVLRFGAPRLEGDHSWAQVFPAERQATTAPIERRQCPQCCVACGV